ncbi:hypothetical protein Z949_673 [Sulfitobacter guttiformis KCTC 32187]|nr:hypothetical protein Z949_673 [Sulfitobacter guttiformis KCTC 32187]
MSIFLSVLRDIAENGQNGLFANFCRDCTSENYVAALNVHFLQNTQFSLRAQRKYAICPTCRMSMSALAWELPLDAFHTNGGNGPYVILQKALSARSFRSRGG